MSLKQNTKEILKERLSVLAVIFSCLAIVVITQTAQQFFNPKLQPTATPAAATPTRPAAAEKPDIQATPPGTKVPADDLTSTSAPSSTKKVNFSGKWVGSFSDSVDGSIYTYQYTLQLVQQGTFISGRSTIQKENDPGAFAKFVIRGQLLPGANTPAIQMTEDLQGVQNLNTGSAVAPRTTRLNYLFSEGQDHLEGEWVDKRYTSKNITGTVKLTRQ